MSRRSDKREKFRQEQRVADLRWLLESEPGRRIVARMIDASGMDVSSAFTGNSSTFYNMGRHDFVRAFTHELRAADLSLFRQMEDEAIADASIAVQAQAQADDDADQ